MTSSPCRYARAGWCIRVRARRAHAAEHLLVERDHQVGEVAAVGDAPGAEPDAVAARAGDRARGGRISAGMISTVQMPMPMRAAIEPSDWPQRARPRPNR